VKSLGGRKKTKGIKKTNGKVAKRKGKLMTWQVLMNLKCAVFVFMLKEIAYFVEGKAQNDFPLQHYASNRKKSLCDIGKQARK
jgi:hypothetical protein